MQSLGIEARLFHPFWSHLRGFLFRDHRKIIAIDRRISFTGGMNVANEYGSSRHNKDASWRDTHVRVEGPTAWEMALVFSEGWERSGGASLHLPPLAPTDASGARTPGVGFTPRSWARRNGGGAGRARGGVTKTPLDYEFLLRPEPDGDPPPGARGSTRRGRAPVVAGAHRHAFGAPRRAWQFPDLLASGVRLFEYQSAILHAKTLVVDDYVSVVGSSNLDFRSFYFNAECNVLILDDATGRTMAQAFEEDLGQSLEMRLETWNHRPLAHRLGDALARCLSPLL